MARNDSTTTINAPTVVGGDKMDESIVTQNDGATQAKRPRIVLGLDDGRLIGETSLPTTDDETREILRHMSSTLDEILLLLHAAVS